MNGVVRFVAVAAFVSACVSTAQAVDIDTVTVGNAGNANHTWGDGYGGVDYVYSIGKYEVTAGQYTKFLNAVAGDDTYGLYSITMFGSSHGCRIERLGSSPNYAYYVGPEWADRPVNYVSWGDAARFANWLHNGQPGLGAPVPQDENSTEDGSYYVDGARNVPELGAVVRKEGATWVIPSEDEWYKATYHYNDGATGNYWNYPTESDTAPTSQAPPGTDMTNGSANYTAGGYVDFTHYRTEVGAYDAKPSDSAYGTLDQGGNVWEWNEAVIVSYRGLRGGSYTNAYGSMHAWERYWSYPTSDRNNIGFRVAKVSDCNDNGLFDECDSDCGDTGGPCDVEGCGQSEDYNGNGVPDECDECVDSLDCADKLICNGQERCVIDVCQLGAPPDTDDGVDCTIDACDEDKNTIVHIPNDASCDNDLYCDGVETCDLFLGCQYGMPVNCDDGVSCTVDACDEVNDMCVHAPDAGRCDDTKFCNGIEICDPKNGCQPGDDPCASGAACDEQTDACFEVVIPTVSWWGLSVLALLLVTAGKVFFGHRRSAPS